MNIDDEFAGRRLLTSFYIAIDEGRFEDAAKFFLENGEWHRKNQVLSGPKAIAAAYDGRDETQRTRHVISNISFESNQQGMNFLLYITFFAGQAKAGEIPTIPGPSMMLTSTGLLVRDGGVWKIRYKKTDRQFMIDPNSD